MWMRSIYQIKQSRTSKEYLTADFAQLCCAIPKFLFLERDCKFSLGP